MRQGEGRDHTDWSWAREFEEAQNQIDITKKEVKITKEGKRGAKLELEEVEANIISAKEEHQRQCQLHREEEMNLYYQCTQNDINNYALHHFGGDLRSYPRWVQEYNVCIDHMQSAKWLWLDWYGKDGKVELRACEPETMTPPVYIHPAAEIIVEPVTTVDIVKVN